MLFHASQLISLGGKEADERGSPLQADLVLMPGGNGGNCILFPWVKPEMDSQAKADQKHEALSFLLSYKEAKRTGKKRRESTRTDRRWVPAER